ncbi:MAG: efflux RND transporter periplasmic adaptor subunit [Phycisphaerae bacterium]|nr:efflux RND transporter periplasmic adaptor subunit [Phycisphaerae bacterium]
MNSPIPIPRRHWFSRLVVPIAIIAATGCLLIYVGWSSIRPATVVHAVPVVIRSVETTDAISESTPADRIIQAPGWVEADPFSVYVGALEEGVIESILVLEGSPVTKGQAIATLIQDDANILLQVAEANHALSSQLLEAAHAQLATMKPTIAAAQSRRLALIDEYTRKEKLVDEGAVAEGPVSRLAISIDTIDAEIAGLHAREVVLGAEVATAKAAVEVANAQRNQALLALDRTTVRSPIDGVVMERLMSPGSVIRFTADEHSSHVLHVYDPEHMQVRADIPLAEASGVGIGHPAEIVVDVLPDRVFTGEVTRFVHRADVQKNTIEAKIGINDPSGLLKPDMLARVRILQPQHDGTPGEVRTVPRVFVPQDAVLEGGFVLLIRDYAHGSGTASMQPIQLGDTAIDGWIEVLGGLSAGDRVILDADQSLDGDVVEINEEQDH